ncbi:MAG: DUF1840 domain-containing protein [Burkholderiaceae bacterium]|nr:DUF1840 domain-containing protein [Burkholderiaceae bacterium]
MLYKFQSRATADLILLEPHGRRLLQIIGKEPSPSGIITAAQIPQALAALDMAVALDERQRAQAQAARHARQSEGFEVEDEDDRTQQVRLHQRAAPFIEMLQRSAADEHDVVWSR